MCRKTTFLVIGRDHVRALITKMIQNVKPTRKISSKAKFPPFILVIITLVGKTIASLYSEYTNPFEVDAISFCTKCSLDLSAFRRRAAEINTSEGTLLESQPTQTHPISSSSLLARKFRHAAAAK